VREVLQTKRMANTGHFVSKAYAHEPTCATSAHLLAEMLGPQDRPYPRLLDRCLTPRKSQDRLRQIGDPGERPANLHCSQVVSNTVIATYIQPRFLIMQYMRRQLRPNAEGINVQSCEDDHLFVSVDGMEAHDDECIEAAEWTKLPMI
jgi:hypothetical protein